MKIGIVCYPTFGGSGVVATELGKALARKGHQVHFITYSQPVRLDSFTENIFYHEVSVSDYPLFDYQPYELVLSSRMVDVVVNEKLDLLHVHYAIPHASAAYVAQQILKDKGIDLPFITTLHGTDITLVGRDASFEPVITFAINHSNAVTAVSESLKADTYKYFKVTREIEVIPNFIRLDDYGKQTNHCNKNMFAPNGEKLLVHVSNFRKVKRVDDVLRVFDKVRKKINAKLILVGDGPERANIEKLCRELKTCDDIISLGKVQYPNEVLAIADLFILPSQTESFGLAALEAMASHVPVISTNTGGLPEVNLNGVTGFTSNVGDVDDMAKNAITILGDDATLKKFKENAWNRSKEFDIAKILPMYEKLYADVLQSALVRTTK
ncbi:MAG TPA: N-acetyl-alpha-D-glucosaminyl L-malate synthase BshA [Bacteroidia bacterium]|jgi:N-acetyl-alpha-D-glucosaminyl L-malate synthase BshA|nr:N-acetyl-alpha-D-glucosaminyl L-malate synthase BshA [Bacteroidia bacterium]